MIRVTRETHDPPTSLCERLIHAGGTNRLGEPNFRVVWGGSRLGWIGGRWVDRDANGNVLREAIELRQVPKYTPTDRWHIERWTPPEDYGSPQEWYARTVEVEDGEGNGNELREPIELRQVPKYPRTDGWHRDGGTPREG